MLHPSLTTWCMVSSSTCSSSASRSSGARKQRARAPGRTGAPRPPRRGARTRRLALRLVQRRTGPPRAARSRRTGVDDLHRRAVHARRRRVRSASCRRTISPSARSSAAASSAPAQPQGAGDVVDGAPRLQLVQEPQPLLRERERQRPRRASTGDDGRQLRAASARRSASTRCRQRRHRGPLEQRAQRQLHAERLADARHDARGQQRVPAQLEEARRGRPRAPRRSTSAQMPASTSSAGVRGATYASSAAATSGRGQRLAVQLAVRRQRQRVQRDERAPAPCTPAGRVRRCARSASASASPTTYATRRVVARRVLAHDDGGLAHGRVRRQHGLDLAQLDAEAADLHLLVHAAQVLQRAVRPPAHAVARAVHRAAGSPNGIGDEALRRQLRAAQVAARHARAAHVQLARHARRARAAARASSTYSCRSGMRPPMGLPPPSNTSSRDSGRYVTWTVVSVRPYMFTSRGDPRPRRSTHSRSAAGSSASPPKITSRRAQLAAALRVRPHELRGRREGVWFSTVTPSRRTSAWKASGSRLVRYGHDDQAPAVQQRAPDLPDGDVERARSGTASTRPSARSRTTHPSRRSSRSHVAVLDQHALGRARGAGRVDDVRQALRRGAAPRIRRAQLAPRWHPPRRPGCTIPTPSAAGSASRRLSCVSTHGHAGSPPACSASRSAG